MEVDFVFILLLSVNAYILLLLSFMRQAELVVYNYQAVVIRKHNSQYKVCSASRKKP